MRVFLWITAILSLILAIILAPISRNFILRKTSESLLSTSFFEVQIDGLTSNHKKIIIKDAHIVMKGNKVATLDNIEVKYNLGNIWKKKELDIAIKVEDKAIILGEKASIKANIDFFAKSKNYKDFTLAIQKISSPILSNMNMGDLEGKCHITWQENDLLVKDCKMNDASSEFLLSFDGDFDGDSPKNLELQGNVAKLPKDLHKELHRLFPQNDILDYLEETLSEVDIQNGSWKVDLPQSFFKDFQMKPEYLTGIFDIENVDYKYLEEYPRVRNIKAKLHLNGDNLDFKIINARAGRTTLSDGNVLLNWGKDFSVKIDVASKGPIRDFIDYIEEKDLKELKKSDIDLTKIGGTSNGNVKILIPLDEKEIEYDIKMNLENTLLAIFDNEVSLEEGLLDGIFDGKQIKIAGKGLVNGFSSDLDFLFNLEDGQDIDNQIKIKANLAPRKLGKNIPLYDVESGSTILDIIYGNKGEKQYFLATSNLTPISFTISKLGIYKEEGRKAILEIKGSSQDDGILPLDITLKGDDIDIYGKTKLSSDITKIHFPKITSNDTSFEARLDIEPEMVKVFVKGSFIDLSKSNMMQFLTKDSSGFGSNIKVNFDALKLKHDVYLDDFMLDIECGKNSCSKGLMHANIGTRAVDMRLYPHDDYEEWRIDVTNAGAMLKGLDIIDNIKAGNLTVKVKTNIKNAPIGRIIPLAEGSFRMEKFVTVDNKFLTRLVSNLSLPGLMNIVKNSNDISFVEMESKFDYIDNIIHIYEGNANGPYMNLTIKGNIDTEEKEVRIKGRVTPSMYGINSIMHKIPVLGRIFGKKNKPGLLSAPYSMKQKY